MEEIESRQFNLSKAVLTALKDYKKKYHTTLSAKEIARAVMDQSDYYIKYPMGKTPWKETHIQVAQAFYYLPLNYLRNLAVATEIKNRYPEFIKKNIVDFGAGMGAASLAIQETLEPSHITAVEVSALASSFAKQLGLASSNEYITEIPSKIEPDTIGWFSYSLTEITNPMPLLLPFDHLVIVEPSTQSDSQKLIDIRQNLIQAGYEILAPCTHQTNCPLQGNRSDWCHDKIKISVSEEMLEVEKHLAWENKDVSFSYLVVSKTIKNKTVGKIRMIGDAQFEKGKTRQMICRSNEREFFSWLDRDKTFTPIARGEVVDPPATFEIKGNELRIKKFK